MKVVQQQWFSGNQSTTSVSNMLSPFVSRLSLSNQILLQKYGYFCVCFHNMSCALFDVGVVQCIIKRGGIHQSSDFLESFHFIFIFLQRNEIPIRNATDEQITNTFQSLYVLFLSRAFSYFWGQQHLSFLWKSLMNPCGAKSALN